MKTKSPSYTALKTHLFVTFYVIEVILYKLTCILCVIMLHKGTLFRLPDTRVFQRPTPIVNVTVPLE